MRLRSERPLIFATTVTADVEDVAEHVVSAVHERLRIQAHELRQSIHAALGALVARTVARRVGPQRRPLAETP